MINLLFRVALLKLHTLLKNSLYMFLFFFSYNVHEIIIENTLYIVLKHIFATKKNNNNNYKKKALVENPISSYLKMSPVTIIS